MKSFRYYLGGFFVIIALYIVYKLSSATDVHWMVTFDEKDKNPFGMYILNEQSQDLFPSELETSYLTLSQICLLYTSPSPRDA